MLIFPEVQAAETLQEATNTGERSILFDYVTSSFVLNQGNIKEPTKLEALKQWIQLFVRTELNKYAIYSDTFGIDLSDLVGYRLPRSAQVSEIIRRLNEGITQKCKHVKKCEDFNFDNGTFSFTVITDMGEEVKFEF